MRIEFVSPAQRGQYVLARAIEKRDFTLTPSSRLGGVAINPVISQPRALKKDGSPDLDIFAFQLKSAADLSKFTVGSEVMLEGLL